MAKSLRNPASGPLRRLGFLVLLGVSTACSDKPAPETAAEARVEPPVAVSAIVVETRPLAQTLVRTGSLRARRIVRIHSQEEGRVEALPVYEGDRVEAGALLVRLDDRLLRAELNKAEATRQQAEQDLARLQRLAGRNLVSADERLRAETALRVAEAEESLLKTRLGYATLTAPFAGLVSERNVDPGDAVPRFAHLVTLVDPQSLVTEVSVSELILPGLQLGDPVQVRIDALGAADITGRVARIHPTVDAATRQGIIEIELTPVPEGAQAGQLCRVYLPGELEPRRTVPLAALRQDPEGEYVYRVSEEGRALRTPVRSGVSLADHIEILEGLSDGDRVITRGFINLSAGKRVQVVTPPEPAPPQT